MNKRIILYFAILFAGYINAQNIESPSWVEFAEKSITGNLSEAKLNDYSYAGYHFSEKNCQMYQVGTQ
jgi:hypothetical protein